MVGPIDFKALRELALQKIILKETEVWQGSEKNRRLAASVKGLIPNKTAKPANFRPPPKIAKLVDEAPTSYRDSQNPYSAPKVTTIQDGPPGGLYLPYLRHSPFYPLPSLLLGAVWLTFLAITYGSTDESRLTLLAFSGMAVIGFIALTLIYLHRAWEMLRVLGSTLAGHKAITFMAIPLFNGVWSFFAILGWARSWNYQVKRHPGLSQASSCWYILFLLFCVSFLASQSFLLAHIVSKDWPTDINNVHHQIPLATFAVTLLLGLGVWAQLCRSINFLARKKS